jgi:regulator of protease activity HflC (stomatin/prohibitin superfamily)
VARYSDSLDDEPLPTRKRLRWSRFFMRYLLRSSFWLILAGLIGAVLWPYMVITVPSGSVGVLWRRFNGFDFYCICFAGRGTALNPREIRDEGFHAMWPWNKLYLYNLRLQSVKMNISAISKDGVSVVAQLSARFQLHHNNVALLHKFIGPDYLDSVIEPEIGSKLRGIISQYTAQEVYVSRELIQNKTRQEVQASLGAHLNQLVQLDAMEEMDPHHYKDSLQDSIQILDTLVLNIDLPASIVDAINRQTEQYYMIQETRFRVEREVEESKRKQVEAQGIAAFQQTVSQGISESYLRWRGIEATSALAASPNSKIVIIGGGKDGLPIILGNTDFPAALSPSTKPTGAPAAAENGAASAASPARGSSPPAPPAGQPPANPAAAQPAANPAPPPGANPPSQPPVANQPQPPTANAGSK